MYIQNKIFAVTGAGGGIGSEIVRVLLERGAIVAALDLRQTLLDELKSRVSDHADRLTTYELDITDKAAVAKLPDTIIKAHGAIDGLVNCAGIIQPFVHTQDLDDADITRVMNVNFFGTVYMTRAFLPHLLTRPEGYIANVSSMGGFLPVPGQGVYGASKAAVKLYTEALYAELLDSPVHVSVVFPGATKTDITANSDVTPPELAQHDQQSFPLLSAHDAAVRVVRGIEHNTPHILVGKDTKTMYKLYRLSPVYATKLIARKMKSLLG